MTDLDDRIAFASVLVILLGIVVLTFYALRPGR